MQKNILRKIIILIMGVFLIAPLSHATMDISNEEIDNALEKLNNIRKQYVALAQAGYYNHFEEQSNENNIQLAKVYIKKIDEVRRELEKSKNQDLNKFSLRKINTLLATTLYLKDMGENLIDYLGAANVEDQYKFYNIHTKLDNFILEILADVEDAEY